MPTQGPCIHPAACLRDYLSSVLPFSLLANLFLSPSAPCLLSASIVNHLIFTSLNPFLNCFIHFLVKGVTGVYIAGHRIYCIANLRLYQVWLRGLLVADMSSCLDLVRSHLAFVSCVFQTRFGHSDKPGSCCVCFVKRTVGSYLQYVKQTVADWNTVERLS